MADKTFVLSKEEIKNLEAKVSSQPLELSHVLDFLEGIKKAYFAGLEKEKEHLAYSPRGISDFVGPLNKLHERFFVGGCGLLISDAGIYRELSVSMELDLREFILWREKSPAKGFFASLQNFWRKCSDVFTSLDKELARQEKYDELMYGKYTLFTQQLNQLQFSDGVYFDSPRNSLRLRDYDELGANFAQARMSLSDRLVVRVHSLLIDSRNKKVSLYLQFHGNHSQVANTPGIPFF